MKTLFFFTVLLAVLQLTQVSSKPVTPLPMEQVFTQWYSFAQLDSQLDLLSKQMKKSNKNLVKLTTIGKSAEKRKLRVLSLGKPQSKKKTLDVRHEFMLMGTMHGREWISCYAILYIAWQLIQQYEAGVPATVELLNNHQVHFFPFLNPDGFEFTRGSKTIASRLWRKNRRALCTTSDRCAHGVDLNRNWGVKKKTWGFGATRATSDVYQGKRPFSEPELKAIQSWLKPRAKYISVFFDVHCCSGEVLPPVYYHGEPAEIQEENLAMAGRIARAMNIGMDNSTLGRRRKFRYKFRPRESEFSESNTGIGLDWIYGEAKVKKAFMIEARGNDTKILDYIFSMSESLITPVSKEVEAGFMQAVRETVGALNSNPVGQESQLEVDSEEAAASTEESDQDEAGDNVEEESGVEEELSDTNVLDAVIAEMSGATSQDVKLPYKDEDSDDNANDVQTDMLAETADDAVNTEALTDTSEEVDSAAEAAQGGNLDMDIASEDDDEDTTNDLNEAALTMTSDEESTSETENDVFANDGAEETSDLDAMDEEEDAAEPSFKDLDSIVDTDDSEASSDNLDSLVETEDTEDTSLDNTEDSSLDEIADVEEKEEDTDGIDEVEDASDDADDLSSSADAGLESLESSETALDEDKEDDLDDSIDGESQEVEDNEEEDDDDASEEDSTNSLDDSITEEQEADDEDQEGDGEDQVEQPDEMQSEEKEEETLIDSANEDDPVGDTVDETEDLREEEEEEEVSDSSDDATEVDKPMFQQSLDEAAAEIHEEKLREEMSELDSAGEQRPDEADFDPILSSLESTEDRISHWKEKMTNWKAHQSDFQKTREEIDKLLGPSEQDMGPLPPGLRGKRGGNQHTLILILSVVFIALALVLARIRYQLGKQSHVD